MMKHLALALAATGVLVGALPFAETAPASPNGAVAAAPLAGAEYVGAETCKKCHIKEHKSWMEMKHSQAWEVLKEEYRTPDAKDEAGRECISCHVTGWGAEGGFVDPTTSENLLGVQCEACHGPGSQHVELGKKMLMERRKELEEGEESFITLHTTNCSSCHNPHVSHAQYK